MKDKIDMKTILELSNYLCAEYCTINIKTGEKIFYKNKIINGKFTGIYFNDEKTFFGLYPTETGPKIFYENNEFEIKKDLTINLTRNGEIRKFVIEEYGIEIIYNEDPYIGLDAWSEEIDRDLFFVIEQKYRIDDFYYQYTKAF